MAPKHNDEFKREAVRIALISGLTRRQVASDLDGGFSTLAKWIQQSMPDDLPPSADIDLAKENESLRKEISTINDTAIIWFSSSDTQIGPGTLTRLR